MLRELENTGLAGDNGEETTLLRATTELILREGPHLAPFGERGERDPHPASPKGRGAKRAYSREGVERFLAAVREHVACLEHLRSAALEDYEGSCREQISVRKVLKKNYVKLEVVLRPGKPHKPSLSLALKLEAKLKQLRKALGGERAGNE